MQSAHDGLRRWRDRLRSAARWFDVDLKTAGPNRQYELWACAMAPELVPLAALMALAERESPESGRDRSPGRDEPVGISS